MTLSFDRNGYSTTGDIRVTDKTKLKNLDGSSLDLVDASDMQAEISGFTRMVPVAWIGTPSVAAYPIINSAHPTIAGAYYFEWSRTTDNRLLDENGLAYLSEDGTILELN